MKRNRKGFSIIWLTVTLAILGLLGWLIWNHRSSNEPPGQLTQSNKISATDYIGQLNRIDCVQDGPDCGSYILLLDNGRSYGISPAIGDKYIGQRVKVTGELVKSLDGTELLQAKTIEPF